MYMEIAKTYFCGIHRKILYLKEYFKIMQILIYVILKILVLFMLFFFFFNSVFSKHLSYLNWTVFKSHSYKENAINDVRLFF